MFHLLKGRKSGEKFAMLEYDLVALFRAILRSSLWESKHSYKDILIFIIYESVCVVVVFPSSLLVLEDSRKAIEALKNQVTTERKNHETEKKRLKQMSKADIETVVNRLQMDRDIERQRTQEFIKKREEEIKRLISEGREKEAQIRTQKLYEEKHIQVDKERFFFKRIWDVTFKFWFS